MQHQIVQYQNSAVSHSDSLKYCNIKSCSMKRVQHEIMVKHSNSATLVVRYEQVQHWYSATFNSKILT